MIVIAVITTTLLLSLAYYYLVHLHVYTMNTTCKLNTLKGSNKAFKQALKLKIPLLIAIDNNIYELYNNKQTFVKAIDTINIFVSPNFKLK